MPPLAYNAEGYRRPEIGEASGSNPRVQIPNRDRTDEPFTSSTAQTSALSASNPLQSAHRVDLVGPDLPPLPLGETNSQGDNAGEEDVRWQEREEARDNSTPLPIPLSTMDIELDNKTVSDFCFDGDASNDRGMSSWNASSTSLASQQGLPLYRTGTRDSIRTHLSRRSLGRAFTNESNLSVAFLYASKFEYTLPDWCQTIRERASLQTAMIIKVDRYYQKAGVRHRFLVFQLRRKGKSRDIFLRLDRLVDAGFNLIKFASASSVTPANDRAFLTADEDRAVRGNTPNNVKIIHEARLVFRDSSIRPPVLSDLQHILDVIILRMTEYRFTRENCWLFCVVCLEGLLKQFKGTFISGDLEHVGLRVILRAAADLRASVYARISESVDGRLFRTISTPSIVFSIAVSPDGNYIASGHSDHSFRLWNAQTGVAVGEPFEGHTGFVVSLAFSPDGRRVVSGSDDETIRLWDIEACTAVGEPLRGHSEIVYSVAFSPDGERIVSGSTDETIRLWDCATGTAIGEPLLGHANRVRSVAFSPDGQTIVSGSDDRRVHLWDTATGNIIGKPLVGHTSHVWTVAFSPNGRHIASGSFDHTIRIWDTATGDQVGEPIMGHTNDVRSVAYSFDGRYIASGSFDGTIRFWDATTGVAIGAPLKGRSPHVISISPFPNGRIASCGGWGDNTICIWKVPF